MVEQATDKSENEVTLTDLIDHYKKDILPMKLAEEVEGYILDRVKRAPFSNKPISELSYADFVAYRDRRLQQVKPVTLKRELGLIAHVLKTSTFAFELSIDASLPTKVRLPRIVSQRTRRLKNDEEVQLIDIAKQCGNPLMLPLIVTAIETGMRRGELFRLKYADFDFTRNVILIRETKNGESRYAILSSKTREALEPIFNSQSTQPIFDMSLNRFRRDWNKIRQSADCPDLHFHDLRHEAISRMFEKGYQLPEVMLLSGHKDYRMLLRYTHLSVFSTLSKKK